MRRFLIGFHQKQPTCKQEAVTVGLQSLDHSVNHVSGNMEQTMGEVTRRIISHNVGQ